MTFECEYLMLFLNFRFSMEALGRIMGKERNFAKDVEKIT